MKQFLHLRSAFTMIELLLVIIVLGILSSLAIPRLDRDLKEEMVDNILSDIRYTQQLALMDDKHLYNSQKWQQRFWHLTFSDCGGNYYYMIGADNNMESANNAHFDMEEAAIDPNNHKPMFYNCTGVNKSDMSSRIFITDKFGVKDIDMQCINGTLPSNGVGGDHIGFDHLGRPHYGFSKSTSSNSNSYIKATCTFEFTMSDDEKISITVLPETGYAYITD